MLRPVLVRLIWRPKNVQTIKNTVTCPIQSRNATQARVNLKNATSKMSESLRRIWKVYLHGNSFKRNRACQGHVRTQPQQQVRGRHTRLTSPR